MASGLSIAGGAILISSGVAAPAGIGLVATGMVTGFASGFTKVGASVVSKVSNSNSEKQVEKIIEEDLKVQENVTDATMEFRTEYARLSKNIPRGVIDEVIEESLEKTGADRVQRAMALSGPELNLNEEKTLSQAGLAEEMGKEIARDVAGTVLQVSVVEASGVIIGLNAVFAIKEAYDFVNIVTELINMKGSEAASELRKTAKELEKNLNANNKSKTLTNAFENKGFINDQVRTSPGVEQRQKTTDSILKAGRIGDLKTKTEFVNTGFVDDQGQTSPDSDDEQIQKTTDGILKAAKLGDLKMMTELHQEGYSLMSTDETGKTGLHYGARFGHKEIIKFLIEKSEDKKLIMDWKDNEKGQTALHKAAAYKRRTICQILVNAGASLAVLDECGQTARALASNAEDLELTSYLEAQEKIQLSRKDFETAV